MAHAVFAVAGICRRTVYSGMKPRAREVVILVGRGCPRPDRRCLLIKMRLRVASRTRVRCACVRARENVRGDPARRTETRVRLSMTKYICLNTYSARPFLFLHPSFFLFLFFHTWYISPGCPGHAVVVAGGFILFMPSLRFIIVHAREWSMLCSGNGETVYRK